MISGDYLQMTLQVTLLISEEKFILQVYSTATIKLDLNIHKHKYEVPYFIVTFSSSHSTESVVSTV